MEASTEADLKALPSSYKSSRALWDLLFGDDPAAAVLRSVLFDENDLETLRMLLSKSPWTEIALQQRHTVYHEDRPRNSDQDVRKVLAMPMSHLRRIFYQAAKLNKPEAVSALLSFASSVESAELPSLFDQHSLYTPIVRGWLAVIEVMAMFYPAVANGRLIYGESALEVAARSGTVEVLAVLLKHGANPNAKSLEAAASRSRLRVLETLIQHGAPVKGNAALHLAAQEEHLDGINLLLYHGAEVDCVAPRDGNFRWGRKQRWTPMHFAASRGLVNVIELLESKGSLAADAKDFNGKTPAHVFIEYKLGKSLKEMLAPSTDTLASLAANTASDTAADADTSTK